MATVQSVMKMRLVTVTPETSAAEAAARMSEENLGAVLVVEGGRLTGIFSERDLVRRVVALGLDPGQTPLAEVATMQPVAVQATMSIHDCARTIRVQGFRHLPVVDAEGRPVGILSTRDFLQYVVDELEVLIDRSRLALEREHLTDPYELVGASG